MIIDVYSPGPIDLDGQRLVVDPGRATSAMVGLTTAGLVSWLTPHEDRSLLILPVGTNLEVKHQGQQRQ